MAPPPLEPADPAPDRRPAAFPSRAVARRNHSDVSGGRPWSRRTPPRREKSAVLPRFPQPQRGILKKVRRIQLNLDDQLWNALHARASAEKRSVSELVRQAIRENHLGSREQRRLAMHSFVSSRKAPAHAAGAVQETRTLRHGSRLIRLDTE